MWKIYLIRPSWFCFGVQRAIKLLEEVIDNHIWDPIYCVHEIVHNPNVVKYFESKWVIFVDNILQIPKTHFKKAIVVFSAHWVDKFLFAKAQKLFKKAYNLVCPLVDKVYKEWENFIKQKRTIFYIWKKGHQEAENAVSYFKNLWANVYLFLTKEEIPNISSDTPIGILNQTTLNFKYVINLIDYIKSKFKNVAVPSVNDICKATFDRQSALIEMLPKIDILIVIWWKNSSNTKELVKIGIKAWKEVYHIEWVDELQNINIDKNLNIGITAWASTPEEDILKVYWRFNLKSI